MEARKGELLSTAARPGRAEFRIAGTVINFNGYRLVNDATRCALAFGRKLGKTGKHDGAGVGACPGRLIYGTKARQLGISLGLIYGRSFRNSRHPVKCTNFFFPLQPLASANFILRIYCFAVLLA